MINILAKMFNFQVQTFNLLFIVFLLRLEVTFQYSFKNKRKNEKLQMQYDVSALGQV